MGKERPLSVNERTFILDSLQEGLRVDGRQLYDFRKIRVSFGHQFGTAEVQLGKTRALAIVTAEIVEPFGDRPTEGFISFNVNFSPMASPAFEPGRASEAAVEVSRIVERGLRQSHAIDTEALCIVAGKKVWFVRVDVHVLDAHGNILDCANLAAIAALLHFKHQDVQVSGQDVKVFTMEERAPVPLSIHHIPVCVTIAMFHDGAVMAVDPSLAEEAVQCGTMSVIITAQKDLCGIQKAGGVALEMEMINRCTQIAAVKAEEITKILKDTLALAKKENNTTRIQLGSIHMPVVRSEAPAGMDLDPVAPTAGDAAKSDGEAESEGEEEGEVTKKKKKKAKGKKRPLPKPAALPAAASGGAMFEGGVSSWDEDPHDGLPPSKPASGYDLEARQEFEALAACLLSGARKK